MTAERCLDLTYIIQVPTKSHKVSHRIMAAMDVASMAKQRKHVGKT